MIIRHRRKKKRDEVKYSQRYIMSVSRTKNLYTSVMTDATAADIAMCQSVAHLFINGVTTRAPNALTISVTPVNTPISRTVQQSGRSISNRVVSDMSNVGSVETKKAAIRMFSWTRCRPGDRNSETTCFTSSQIVCVWRSERGSDSERGAGSSRFSE